MKGREPQHWGNAVVQVLAWSFQIAFWLGCLGLIFLTGCGPMAPHVNDALTIVALMLCLFSFVVGTLEHLRRRP